MARVDVYPTVLAALRLPVPQHAVGRPLPLVIVGRDRRATEDLLRRLEALGYMGHD